MSKEMLEVSSVREGDNNEWEELCPELFALILKAVQENAGRDAGEARRVVALAGVCRRWRQLIKQSYTSPLAEMGLMQFPFSLRQPGPCNRPVRCLFKRRRGGIFMLFQQNFGDGGKEKLDFLMAARREWRACGSGFAISASHTCFSKSGHAYMGKLRSDFWGAQFSLWEAMGNYQQKSKRLAVRISYSDCLREGLRERAMACELTRVPSGRRSEMYPEIRRQPATGSGGGTMECGDGRKITQAIAVRYAAPSFLSCLPLPPLQPHRPPASKQKAPTTFLRSYSSLRRANYSFSERKANSSFLEKCNSKAAGGQLLSRNSSRGPSSRELGGHSHAFFMESKTPHWDEQSQCWSLDFRGRASVPSQYNFQLVQSPTYGDGPSNTNAPSIEGNETIFLQLGKVGKGLYSVDYCHPLSAFQAFSICLTSFATKVGVDP